MFNLTKEVREALARNGWEIECESPLEIRHVDGSFATGLGASGFIDSLMGEEKANGRGLEPEGVRLPVHVIENGTRRYVDLADVKGALYKWASTLESGCDSHRQVMMLINAFEAL